MRGLKDVSLAQTCCGASAFGLRPFVVVPVLGWRCA
jgi:hypothetical protein